MFSLRCSGWFMFGVPLVSAGRFRVSSTSVGIVGDVADRFRVEEALSLPV